MAEHNIHNTYVTHKQSLSRLERLAVWVTNHVGSMKFFFFIVLWTVLWFGWNTFAPYELRFDSFPAFVLWLFISNMIQIFLMPLIMIGQNLQGRHSELRAESDYKINMRAEEQITEILERLKVIEEKLGK